jgi:hypothetical protein
MDAGGNTNKRKILLEILECYQRLPILWDTNHVAKESKAYNELLNKFKQVEPNAMRDTMVQNTNSLCSEFHKQLKKVRDSKRLGASAYDVYEPSLWYFNKRFLFLFLDLSRAKQNVK